MSSSKPIFCLICDRAPGYFQMTIQAIKCLRKHTKTAAIGVLFPPSSGNLKDNETAVLDALKALDSKIDRTNIFFKEGKNHFENWNPTQHKLDIELFAQDYDPVIWLDSDTVVLKDLVPFINNFMSTGKKFAFLADHVNNDPQFQANWEGPLFVPQACYMIFRSAYIPAFFKVWEETWREWIQPYPFQRHKDPAPHFNNSFFCIEQYALGQSIFKFVSNFDNEVHRIDRGQLFIGRNVAVETQRIKKEFQEKSAARPSAVAHIPHNEEKFHSPLVDSAAPPVAVPRSPMSVPISPLSVPIDYPASTGPTTEPTITTREFNPIPATTIPATTIPVTTTYAPEADEAGFVVTATYTTAPGAFLPDGSASSSSSSRFPAGEGQIQAPLTYLSSYPTSYAPSSYVSSYTISSYPTSYTRVTSYTGTTSYGVTTSYGASATTSYGASATTSYGASATTSYGASATTSYGASATTSYGATTSYTGASSYASSYISSYPSSSSYGYISSLSSAGLTPLYTEDGGLPLTNYGSLSLQFSLPNEGGESEQSSMYVYGALDSNVYFLTTNAALASSSQAANLSNSNNEFYMVDLIQDNSIAHYYNANQGVNSNFVADHGTVIANTFTQIKQGAATPAAADAPAKAPSPAGGKKGKK